MESSENKKCYVCGSCEIENTGYSLRDDESIKVLRCKRCSLVFLSSFEHINKDFYKDGKMHSGNFDHKKWLEASYNDDRRRLMMLKKTIKGKKILDFGCGAGGFLVMGVDYAFRVGGIEKEELMGTFFSENNNEGFENSDIIQEKINGIKIFHVMENPHCPKISLKKIHE